MNSETSNDKPGPLAGLKVLDLSRFIAGPHCAAQLADLGADVVKVERTGLGDDTRSLLPKISGESIYFMVFNRNKRSISLNFRDPKAQEILRLLVKEADILIENFRPGTMEKMGCGWDVLHKINPRLVMASISGYGQTGKMSKEPCFDGIAQAASGLMDITGSSSGPPTVAGTFVVDYATALYAAVGILAAVEHRHRSGVGQLVDVSLMGSAMSLLMTAIPEKMLLGNVMSRMGNNDRYSAPADVYQTKDDRWVYLIAGNDTLFPRLASIMGRNDLLEDPRFSTLKCRLSNRAEIDAIVSKWARLHTASDVIKMAKRAEIPGSLVQTVADVIENPYTHEAGHIVTVNHPIAGQFPAQGSPIRLSETPSSVRTAAPVLGGDTETILSEWLGMSSAEVTSLREEKVV